MPTRLQKEIVHARSFAETIHGAALLYNLMLSEECANEGWVDRYRDALADWSHRMRSLWGELVEWYCGFASFWHSRSLGTARTPRATRDFVNKWCERVFGASSPESLADDGVARDMIRRREFQLKGVRARLGNPGALKVWRGASGIERLDYRWRNVRVIVKDIIDGLHG